MFCPICKAEYMPGITECPECDVLLVEKLTEEQDNVPELTAVLSTFSLGDVAIIKSILDAAGVHYFFKGERFLGLVKPWADPAKLMVKKTQAEEVKSLLKDLKLQECSFFAPHENKGDNT